MNQALCYNVYQQDCPARLFFETLADKWVLLIMNDLKQQSKHFNLLKKDIQGISPKVLSQKLKKLERDGFIQRKVIETAVLRVEYSLTEFGWDFAKTAYQMKEWAELNIEHVLEAQQRYDVLNQAEA